ncbi:MAG: hypothetical protein JSV08_03760 [Acidobacteriota bacterium]|nr:MAG: hypothetical protein JSV08_03760 [Acidobacteriota bacterium]
MNEHRTYLPAVGFVVAAAFLLGLITTKSKEVHEVLGAAYGNLGRWTEEVEAHKHAILLKPDLAKAHLNLGITYSILNRRGDALEEYKILKELDKKRAEKLFDLIYE